MKRPKKPPGDMNQRGAEIVRLSTEEPETIAPRSPVSEYLSEIGRKGGLKGGKARARELGKKKMRAIGKKAAAARWSKKK